MRIRNKKIILILFSLLFAFSLTLSGCGDSDSAAEGNTTTAAEESTASTDAELATEMTTFTDDCGRTIEVPDEIKTVIASGNLAQIILYAIAPDKLIAINGSWTEEAKGYLPDEFLNLPEVGSFFGNHDLNYEEIAKMSPDIIIDVGEDKPSMKSDLEDITTKTGIPAVHITANYDDMDVSFEKLGKLLDKEDKAKQLSEFCVKTMDEATKTMDKVKEKKTIMYCTMEDGLNVLARNSYHSQIIDWIGDNVAVLDDPSSQGTGNEVNLEQMMIWDPEVIIFAPGSYYDYVADDPAWQTLDAIKNNHYYEVPSGPYSWMGSPPSCNRLIGILWMAKLLYPEQADYDLMEYTKEFYRLFYNYELSNKEYKALVTESIMK